MTSSANRLGIVYFGSGEFGIPTLEAVHSAHGLRAIVTQPDRPAGRARKPSATPVGDWAAAHAPTVPVFKPGDVNEEAVVSALRGLEADLFLVIAFGQKLGRPLLADRTAINLHASLLPRWRGAAPINWAIIAGDQETGNSVITVAERMDAGAVLAQSVRPIPPTCTAGELHDLLAADGPALVQGVLSDFSAGSLRPREQDASLVTVAPKLRRSDAAVDWSLPAPVCSRRINGLSPWPGVTAPIGGAAVKLIRASTAPMEIPTIKVGTGCIADSERGLVQCGEGSLMQILEVQPAGGRPMAWSAFARGRAVRAGDSIREEGSC